MTKVTQKIIQHSHETIRRTLSNHHIDFRHQIFVALISQLTSIYAIKPIKSEVKRYFVVDRKTIN